MNGAGCRHWWRSSQGRFAAICLLSLATAAEASGGPCDSEVWSNSKCCRGERLTEHECAGHGDDFAANRA